MQGRSGLNIKKKILLPLKIVKAWNKGVLSKYLHGDDLDMDRRMISLNSFSYLLAYETLIPIIFALGDTHMNWLSQSNNASEYRGENGPLPFQQQ